VFRAETLAQAFLVLAWLEATATSFKPRLEEVGGGGGRGEERESYHILAAGRVQ
jgi:hypothetical protein